MCIGTKRKCLYVSYKGFYTARGILTEFRIRVPKKYKIINTEKRLLR